MRKRFALGVLVAVLLAFLGWTDIHGVTAETSTPVVYVISIEGMIDLGLAPFLARTIREAKEAGAAAVLLDINTFGGRVDAAVAMRDTLLNSPVRTIAFVNQRAISAGALIALACETLVMTKGGTIGAPRRCSAGPAKRSRGRKVGLLRTEGVPRDGGGPESPAGVCRSDGGRRRGDRRGDRQRQAAHAHDLGSARAQGGGSDGDTVDAALEAAGLPGAEVRYASQTWAETFVRFLTNPVVSSLLMTVGLLGLLVEIRTPGFAVPGTIGLLSLGLFFWGHWIVRLAGWEELLLVSIGVLLIALEVFVLPGTTLAGIAGVSRWWRDSA
jgi:membrane-bound serine protease (ClpP class)